MILLTIGSVSAKNELLNGIFACSSFAFKLHKIDDVNRCRTTILGHKSVTTVKKVETKYAGFFFLPENENLPEAIDR